MGTALLELKVVVIVSHFVVPSTEYRHRELSKVAGADVVVRFVVPFIATDIESCDGSINSPVRCSPVCRYRHREL